MRGSLTILWRVILLGCWLGFTVSMIGFSDFDELHRMFIFWDLRMLFSFGGAVVIIMISFRVIRTGMGRCHVIDRPIHRGTVLGGLLFGAGWALSGGCPAIPLVQLGEGKFAALATAAGICVGILLFRYLQPRYFRWDTGPCLR